MFLKSRLFWGGMLLCICIGVLLSLLLYKAKQPQDPIIIYKTVMPEGRAASQASDISTVQTSDAVDETETIFTPMDPDVSIDPVDSPLTDTQVLDTDVLTGESVSLVDSETESVSEPEEERFFGLTRAEIKARIPGLEKEIRANLTKAVELYEDLRSTDGMAGKSPKIAAWRDETWNEVKCLFHDVADTGKILQYTYYLKVLGEEADPLLPGGWISELTKPLPMRVTYGGTSP